MRKITLDQIAVMSVQYMQYSFAYYLDSMVKCGVKHIDLWGGLPHYCRLDYLNTVDAQRALEGLRRMAEQRGLDYVVYTPETLAYPYSFTDPSVATTQRTIDYFKMAMEDARILGTNKVFLNAGCGLRDLPREESMKRLVDTYQRIAALADQYEIELVLEQLQPYESNLVTSLEDIAYVCKQVNSKRLSVCVDVVAMAVAGETLESYFDTLGKEKIALIHFADTCHYILGSGELPLKAYWDTLEHYEYEGIVDLEINDSIYWGDPHDSIMQSMKWLQNVMQ